MYFGLLWYFQNQNLMTTQSNKRKIIIQDKEYDSLESAAKAFGKSRNTVDYRLSKGWTPEQSVDLVPPPSFASKTAGIPVQVEGCEFKTLKEAANTIIELIRTSSKC